MFRTTPLRLLQEEAGFLPAEKLLSYRQNLYILRALQKPIEHLVNSLLPPTLRYGELQAQPEQYPNSNLDWRKDTLQKGLGKHLAQQLVKDLNINLEAGLEVTYKDSTQF
jgi:hypothetical protein